MMTDIILVIIIVQLQLFGCKNYEFMLPQLQIRANLIIKNSYRNE
jgi:hypothetical protein